MTGRAVLLAACFVLVAGAIAWRYYAEDSPLELGRTFDPSGAVGLADILAAESSPPAGRTIIRGRIGEVCRSAGCWFVLQEIKDDHLYEVLVDLKKAGAFTVDIEVSGRQAIVAGKFVKQGADVTFEADGARLE